MQPELGHRRTHLFLVRLWVEPSADDPCEVRMQVRHALDGEIRYFRAWTDLETFLLAKLQELEAVSRQERGDQREIHDLRE